MSLTVLFKTKKPSRVGTIVLDAAISDRHEMLNDVTDFPVEDGAPINDHIWAKPRRYTITGLVTNSPVVILGAFGRNVAAGETPQTANYDFVGKAFEELEEMHRRRELIEIYTPLKLYKNMAIESIEIDRSANTGGALPFTMQVKEVRRVSSQQVAFTVAKKPKSGKAAATAKTGKQTPTPPAKPQQVSILKTLLGGGL